MWLLLLKNVVSEKKRIFHELEVSKSSIKTHNFVRQGCFFSFIVISQLRRPIKLKFCYFMHMYTDVLLFCFHNDALIDQCALILKFVMTSTNKRLKTVDTIGDCQRPVFSLCVSQHMHTKTNLYKFELNHSSKLRENN